MPRIPDERPLRPRPEIVDRLRTLLPAASVLATPAELAPYECDGLTAFRQRPMVVVLPETVEQVQAVLRVCHAARVPVVARGAGTGLSGGALPLADGVLLSLAKFNRILEIDTANCTARVQPGVRNLAITEAAAPQGCTTRRTHRRRLPVRSAAMLPRTLAACTA